MAFNSFEFMAFFVLVVIGYYLAPQKAKNIWLLVANYAFYMYWNVGYAVLLTFTILTSYGAALLLERRENRKDKTGTFILAVSVLLNLGILFFYKYLNFALRSVALVLMKLNVADTVPQLKLLLPVGISFYTFKAVGYLLDIRKGKYACERNLVSYAAFISFFPAILSGPIDRADHFLPQLREQRKFDGRTVKQGMLLMLWGYFVKMVLSDRAAQFTTPVLANYKEHSGAFVLVAVILYAVQIYCDFSGYSSIARGAAAVMGFRITENFRQPYFATSIAEFWRRWHISLSSWLRDYVYIGLGGNRCSVGRKYVNLMVTFLVSGLWHGASWNFIVWGALHGFYQIFGAMTKPWRRKALQALKVDTEGFVHKTCARCINFALVSFAWIFFCADGTKEAIRTIWHMITSFQPWTLFDGSLFEVALSRPEFSVLILGLLILWVVDILKYRNVNIQGWLEKQHVVFRWMVYYAFFFAIVLLGVYGSDYSASQFIYFQF